MADKSDTDQGKVNKILEDLFKIKTGFHGQIISNLARLSFEGAVEAANEKHMRPWTDICKRANIDSTPLSPFMSSELLEHYHLYIDGTKIEKETGFSYSIPQIDLQRLEESVVHAVETGIFPRL